MAVVAFGVFVAADDLMVVATMLRPIIDHLGLVIPDDLDDAAWIVNAYLIAYIAAMPIAGRLSDVVGRRPVFVASLVLFAVGSLVVPLAGSLPMLLAGRVLTAAGGGALVPIAFAVAADLHTGSARARAMGLLGAIETLGWVWGPLYGALLVRYLSWEWQFYLNVPLAAAGIVAGWRVLAPTEATRRTIDWAGVASLTVALVALNVALLSGARIQSVTGLDELSGSDGVGVPTPVLYAVAAVALAVFVLAERRADDPVIGLDTVTSPLVGAALAVNALLGAGLVVALINVPLFVNIVEGDIERSAVRAGWLLTALTATMAAASYLGGVLGGRIGHRWPTAVGLAIGAAGLGAMGLVWSATTGAAVMAAQLALVGAGVGIVLAPTSTSVVDAAGHDQRGSAAGLVIVARLVGFSIGLAALTAWGLRRYDALRTDLDLPPITDPDFAAAAADASVRLSTTALAETFVGAALALAVGTIVAAGWMAGGGRTAQRMAGESTGSPPEQTGSTPPTL